jgi:hypothetical protein
MEGLFSGVDSDMLRTTKKPPVQDRRLGFSRAYSRRGLPFRALNGDGAVHSHRENHTLDLHTPEHTLTGGVASSLAKNSHGV